MFRAEAGDDVVLVAQRRTAPSLSGVQSARGWPNGEADNADVVVLATESAHQFALAKQLVRAGTTVISTADDPQVVQRLWELDDLARANQALLVVGASYSPGVSSVLAAHLVRGFDEVSAIRTAQFGTGGPSCAREHHRAMGAAGREVNHGLLRATRGGSGRELVWFPDPVGAADCYRAGLAEPFLLHQAFPAVPRIESRQAATRRDRLTSRLPMLRPPHAEGLVGAVWVEVRGTIDGRVEHRAMAATAPQATGAGSMVSAVCQSLTNEPTIANSSGVRSTADPTISLSMIPTSPTGVRLWTYDGSLTLAKSGVQSRVQAARKWPLPGADR